MPEKTGSEEAPVPAKKNETAPVVKKDNPPAAKPESTPALRKETPPASRPARTSPSAAWKGGQERKGPRPAGRGDRKGPRGPRKPGRGPAGPRPELQQKAAPPPSLGELLSEEMRKKLEKKRDSLSKENK